MQRNVIHKTIIIAVFKKIESTRTCSGRGEINTEATLQPEKYN